jgi:hypothetical protein
MIYASDSPPGIKAQAHYGRHKQTLVDRGFGEQWECDCAEYRTPKPNTPRAFCEHTQRASRRVVQFCGSTADMELD